MTGIDLNRIASDIHLNAISLNGVNISEEHPEYDMDVFQLDVTPLDSGYKLIS